MSIWNQSSNFVLDLLTQNTRTKPIYNIPPKLHQNHTVFNIYISYIDTNTLLYYRFIFEKKKKKKKKKTKKKTKTTPDNTRE